MRLKHRSPQRLVMLALITYVILAGARSMADRPIVDEAWFASPAMNLAHHGSMGTSIFESRGTYAEGLDQYTYWILPAYPVALAGWFEIAGAGLLTIRVLSTFFGSIVVLAIYVLVARLMSDRVVGAMAALLVAIDFALVRAGAMGRMDSMCAALGLGGLAVYLHLRERSVPAAFLAGHTLVAVSVFTHPNGVVYFLGLMLTVLWRDRAALRLSSLALGAVPYLVLLALWAGYIAHDPALFRRQFGGNASGRFSGVWAPLAALERELRLRYLAGGQMALRVALLLPYLLGLGAALLAAPLRRHRGVQTLLALPLVVFVYHWLFEAIKLHFYTVHLTPFGMALFAVALRWAWREHRRWRAAIGVTAALLVAVQLAGTAYTLRRNSYRATYQPVVDVVRTHAGARHLVMGSAELAFGLGFDANLVDDIRLGYHSDRRPDVVVLDRRYKEWFALLRLQEPQVSDHVNTVLEQFASVFTLDDYEVLVRSPD